MKWNIKKGTYRRYKLMGSCLIYYTTDKICMIQLPDGLCVYEIFLMKVIPELIKFQISVYILSSSYNSSFGLIYILITKKTSVDPWRCALWVENIKTELTSATAYPQGSSKNGPWSRRGRLHRSEVFYRWNEVRIF